MEATAKMASTVSVLMLLVVGSLATDVHVSIINRVGKGRSLNLHCQSGDNDLGPQTLPEGEEYGWGFKVNVVGTTLFYCDLAWGSSVAGFSFDAYDYQRDNNRCDSQCQWLVAAEGVYGWNQRTGLWEFMYHW